MNSHRAANPAPCVYRTVLFDADDTLFDYDRSEKAALERVFGQFGIRFDPAYITAYRIINQELWRQLEGGLIKPDSLKVRRFELLLQKIGLKHSARLFSQKYLESLANCSELVDGAYELLKSLEGNCQVAIVTNGLTAVQRNRVRASPIRSLVSKVIISEEIGHAKPSREFFDVAFARLGHPPKSQVLMVGDSWSSDIMGAINYGIDACWFNPKRQPRPDGLVPKYEVIALTELQRILLPNGRSMK